MVPGESPVTVLVDAPSETARRLAMLLNLGCGDPPVHAPPPWVNVDNWPGAQPDVLADVCDLPFGDGEAEAVYAGHILEHLDRDADVPRFLGEVRRVLGEYGQACFVGPDVIKVRLRPEWAEWVSLVDHGDDDRPGTTHLWPSTGRASLEMIRRIFPAAHEVDMAVVPDFWPVANPIGWQFAIMTGEA